MILFQNLQILVKFIEKSIFHRDFVQGQMLQINKFGKMLQIFAPRILMGQKEDSGKLGA